MHPSFVHPQLTGRVANKGSKDDIAVFELVHQNLGLYSTTSFTVAD